MPSDVSSLWTFTDHDLVVCELEKMLADRCGLVTVVRDMERGDPLAAME